VRQLIAKDQLGAYLEQRYPERHAVQSDKALYAYALALKQEHLRNAPAIDKVLFDIRLDLTHRALGLHTTISRVQGRQSEVQERNPDRRAVQGGRPGIFAHDRGTRTGALQGIGPQQSVLQTL
jgi:hypothetical protein